MTVEQIAIDDIHPYYNNPRNNDAAVSVVAKSIEEFGFRVPIIVDKDKVIIAGHTRWLAAQQLSLDTVPVIVASDLNENQIHAFRIMDNKSSEFSNWDFEKLAAEIDKLEGMDCNMDSLGFDLVEIEKIKLDFAADTPPESRNYSLENNEEIEEEGGDSEKESKPSGSPVIQYTIVFNTEEEQKAWYDYLKSLKFKYPDYDTISERIIEDIQQHSGTL